MKFRLLLILAGAFIVTAGFSSCTRDYICQCTIIYTGQPGLPDTVVREYPIKDKKNNAGSVCEANSGSWENGDIKTIEDCHLY